MLCLCVGVWLSATMGAGDTGGMAQTWGGEDKRSNNRHKLKRGLGLLLVAAQQGHAPAQVPLPALSHRLLEPACPQ